MKDVKSLLEEYLINSKDEEIIWIGERAFLIRPASDDDIERVSKGYFSFDTAGN